MTLVLTCMVIHSVWVYFQDADKFCEEAASEQLKKMSFQNKVVIDELTGPKYTKKGYSDPVVGI